MPSVSDDIWSRMSSIFYTLYFLHQSDDNLKIIVQIRLNWMFCVISQCNYKRKSNTPLSKLIRKWGIL